MSEDTEKILRMDLKALLVAAEDLYVDVDQLCEAAIQSMLSERANDAEDLAGTMTAIEVAADSLQVMRWPEPL
ncbi:hypothetical protein ALQ28_00406 [Pseudomonas syringae pv. delphinii]|uniref:Uncharacterized protein n=1 Tax=Pseudomonas syringae pv. delphinii TaxID=192088 RepID=A0A0N8RDB8_9PSED|nr:MULTISPECIES: hypothetical protein [Pseudomonas syringae group]KPX17151.1 Unknown protein sequence [Pseudomonas syringae pv. delphinii]RMP11009.1 hypothetical protein ALQ28_00406 [Pseudomonas syringae pv. delphinii]